jgi:hypothetical protein
MSAPYTGNPTSPESPSLAPGPGILPIVTIPADPDGASWANVNQPIRVPPDWLAYLMNGHFSSFFQENFLMANATYTTAQTPIPNYAVLRSLVNGTQWSLLIGDEKAQIGGATTASGDYCYLATSGLMNNTSLGNSSQYSIEFDFGVTGASFVNAITRLGLGDNALLHSATNYCILQTTPSSSVWTLNVNGTTSALSSGFNPIGTIQRIRIVGFGSATATGVANGSAITKVYINDAFATSVNACSTAAMFASFGIRATGAVSVSQVPTCNAITMRWNRF